jgi:predicted Zn-dependent protease
MYAVVHVLNSQNVGAFSWPNGHIFVTAGLIDRVTSDELTAALAHEFGHLLADGRIRMMASLRGCDHDRDAEVRADGVGMELLRLQGLPPTSMIQLLVKVQTLGQLPGPCNKSMEGRIRTLRERLQQNAVSRDGLTDPS